MDSSWLSCEARFQLLKWAWLRGQLTLRYIFGAAPTGTSTGWREECDLDAELRDAFDIYDINGDGRISVAELSKVLGRIGEGCSTEECKRR
ncbi:hypothetical protein QYE76_048962 [Lolium multiflorum]|uniref:EF-hand domain-containing protein n=1 Tax=Lolium multiflorum TaxID=4521 RepID=A0AAD8WHT3_LOLMU|nr:hypothetical protein QYE76_048962 [Lolium multiflorum]